MPDDIWSQWAQADAKVSLFWPLVWDWAYAHLPPVPGVAHVMTFLPEVVDGRDSHIFRFWWERAPQGPSLRILARTRDTLDFHDLTIRPAEVQRITDGKINWCFYGWFDHGKLVRYAFVNLIHLVSCGMFEDSDAYAIHPNQRGDSFRAYHMQRIRDKIGPEDCFWWSLEKNQEVQWPLAESKEQP